MKNYFMIALEDVLSGFLQYSLWMTLGWRDVRSRYVRTTLGPLWLTASMAIFTVAFGTIYANLFKQDITSYLPFIVSSFLSWTLISSITTESCVAFTSDKDWINNHQFPYSIIIFRIITRNFIVFFHHLLIMIGVYVFFGKIPNMYMLWIFPALFIYIINSLWLGLLLGTLCSRFRDVSQLINNLLQILLFITPVFWKPEMLTASRATIVNFNAVYHILNLLRSPLLGGSPPMISIIISIIFCISGTAIAFLFYGRYRYRIPFWV